MSADSEELSRPPSLPPLLNMFQGSDRVAGGKDSVDWSNGVFASLTTDNSGTAIGKRRADPPPPLALPTEHIGLEPITPEGPVSGNGQSSYQVYSFAARVCVPQLPYSLSRCLPMP